MNLEVSSSNLLLNFGQLSKRRKEMEEILTINTYKKTILKFLIFNMPLSSIKNTNIWYTLRESVKDIIYYLHLVDQTMEL